MAEDGDEQGPVVVRLGHGALRGVMGAMAMTGMREFTRHVGLLEEPPPEAIMRQRLLPGPLRRPKRGRHRAVVELMHWSYGGVGGVGFAALPAQLRARPFTGPLYGLAVWGSFELGVSPLLGLSQSKRKRPVDRLTLIVDHLLYGLVLSEARTRPQG